MQGVENVLGESGCVYQVWVRGSGEREQQNSTHTADPMAQGVENVLGEGECVY